MSKINVWGLERAEAPVHDVVIKSKEGEDFAFQVQATNSLRGSLALDRFNELVEKYITGNEDVAPVPFPPIAGKRVIVGKTAFQIAATLEAVCVGENAYTAEEFIAMSHARPEVVKELFERVKEIQGNELQGTSTPVQHLSVSPCATDTTPT